MEIAKPDPNADPKATLPQKTEVLAEIHLNAPEKLKDIYKLLDIPTKYLFDGINCWTLTPLSSQY